MGLMVRRRASQASRSAVSGLSGPAPSSSGGASSLRCTIRVVGLRLTPPSVGAALPGERDERVRGGLLPVEHDAGLLVERALGLGDLPDGLFEGAALLERQAPAERELAPPARPGHAQRSGAGRAPGRRPPQAGRCVRAASSIALGALPTATRASSASLAGVAYLAAAATWSRLSAPVLSAWSSAGRLRSALLVLRDPRCGAVVAAGDLRQPLRAGRAARRLPVALVVGLAHDLREPLREARLLLADARALRAGAPRGDAPAPDRPSPPVWRTYVRMLPATSQPKCAEIVPKCSDFP